MGTPNGCVECRLGRQKSRLLASFVVHGRRRRTVYNEKRHCYAKTTEQHLIVRSGKSEAEVTTNKRLWSRYCVVEANY